MWIYTAYVLLVFAHGLLIDLPCWLVGCAWRGLRRVVCVNAGLLLIAVVAVMFPRERWD